MRKRRDPVSYWVCRDSGGWEADRDVTAHRPATTPDALHTTVHRDCSTQQPRSFTMTSAVTTANGTQIPDQPGTDVVPVAETTLLTAQGKTSIADVVVEKIAGMATREVTGVYKLGGGAARAFGAIRERIPGQAESLSQGVSVEVGERQAAVDLDITVEYGVEIGELSKAIRRNVISAIERMTTLEVTEVNIVVHDVYVPRDDDDDDHQDARVA